MKTAYLNEMIEEELYMRQSSGFDVIGKEEFVYKLKRSIYELKSARCWIQALHTVLLSLLFKRCNSNPCLYVKWNGKKTIFFLYMLTTC